MYRLTKSGKIALSHKNISASTLQLDLKIGYISAANIIEALKQAKILKKNRKKKMIK